MPFPPPTSGIGVAVKVAVDSTLVFLSLSGVKTHTVVPTLQDVVGTTKTTATPHSFISRCPAIATVNASGVITGVKQGRVVIEVSYPLFDNALGSRPDGTPSAKISSDIEVVVTK